MYIDELLRLLYEEKLRMESSIKTLEFYDRVQSMRQKRRGLGARNGKRTPCRSKPSGASMVSPPASSNTAPSVTECREKCHPDREQLEKLPELELMSMREPNDDHFQFAAAKLAV